MEKTYVITWQSNLGAFTRRGTKLFTKEEAEQLAADLNEEHPEIHHEILNTAPTTPAPEPPSALAVNASEENTIIRGVDFGANANDTANGAISATPEPAVAMG